jgi:hypothetical protein
MGVEVSVIENNKQEQFGYSASRLNAVKHGILSHHAILPWENKEDYDSLLDSLEAEYQPTTCTESHLVEELAGIMWRKARVRLAEGSVFRNEASKQMEHYASSVPDYVKAALVTTTAETKALKKGLKSLVDDVSDAEANEACEGLAYWEERHNHFQIHERTETMALLDDEGRADWLEYRQRSIQQRDEYGYEHLPDDQMFADWLKSYVDHFREMLAKNQHAPAIRQQIIGLSYATERMDGIARYETHLDRKFERVLAMLLKLKDLNRQKTGVV